MTDLQTALEPASKPFHSRFNRESPEHAAAAWLAKMVTKSQAGIFAIVADCTPALALVLLDPDRNEDNRPVSQMAVDKLAGDMAKNFFALNGEGMIISKDGKMNDGQHRCLAVIKSGRTIPMLFVFGVERETRTTLDQGRVRTAAIYLAAEGYRNTTSLAAAASYVIQYLQYNVLAGGSSMRPTKRVVVDMVKTHPNIVRSSEVVGGGKLCRLYGGPGLLTFCHWVFAHKDPADAAEFIHSLINGTGRDWNPGNPINFARNRLAQLSARDRPNDKAELIFYAWNAWRRGKRGKNWPIRGGKLPEVED